MYGEIIEPCVVLTYISGCGTSSSAPCLTSPMRPMMVHAGPVWLLRMLPADRILAGEELRGQRLIDEAHRRRRRVVRVVEDAAA